MNLKLVLIAGVVACVGLAAAQGAGAGRQGGPGRGPGGPGGGMHRMTTDQRLDRMGKTLNLTAAQKKKLKPIMEANAKKGKAIFEDKKMSDTKKRDAFKKMMDDYNKQLKKILTAAQYKKWEEMRAKRGGPGGPGGGRRGGPGGPPKGAGGKGG